MLTIHYFSYPFVPKNFSSGISNLHITITITHFWISSNYLTIIQNQRRFVPSSLCASVCGLYTSIRPFIYPSIRSWSCFFIAL